MNDQWLIWDQYILASGFIVAVDKYNNPNTRDFFLLINSVVFVLNHCVIVLLTFIRHDISPAKLECWLV